MTDPEQAPGVPGRRSTSTTKRRGVLLNGALPLSAVLLAGCAPGMLEYNATGADDDSPVGLDQAHDRPSYSEVDRLLLAFGGDDLASNREFLVAWLRAHDTEEWCKVEDNEFKRRELISRYEESLRAFSSDLALTDDERTFTYYATVDVGEYDFEEKAFPLSRSPISYWEFEYGYKDWWNTGGDNPFFDRSAMRCESLPSPTFTQWKMNITGPNVEAPELLQMDEEAASKAIDQWDERTLHMAIEVRYEDVSFDALHEPHAEPEFSVSVQSVRLYEEYVDDDEPYGPGFRGLVHEIDYP